MRPMRYCAFLSDESLFISLPFRMLLTTQCYYKLAVLLIADLIISTTDMIVQYSRIQCSLNSNKLLKMCIKE